VAENDTLRRKVGADAQARMAAHACAASRGGAWGRVEDAWRSVGEGGGAECVDE